MMIISCINCNHNNDNKDFNNINNDNNDGNITTNKKINNNSINMIKEKKAGNVEKYYITIDQTTLSNIYRVFTSL